MDPENTTKSDHVNIALIQKDIGFIREMMAKMEATMASHDKIYATKESLTEVVKDMERAHEDMKKLIATKVNNSDFDPIKSTLGKLNWLLISTVFLAIIGIVVAAAR